MPELETIQPFSAVALGLRANSLGEGLELATPLSQRMNLRFAGSVLNISYPFNINGVDYHSEFHTHSGMAMLDWFPRRGGFRVSAGVLYFKIAGAASASVVAGQTFTIEDGTYLNSVDDPVHGTATISYGRSIAPAVTVGFGNIIPRSGRRWSFPIEVGAAYTGPGHLDMTLAGTACTYSGCFNAGTNPLTQNDLKKQVNDTNATFERYPLYPIVSLGAAYRF